MYHLSICISQNLDLDMARRGDELFCIDPVMIKRDKRFMSGVMKLNLERCGLFNLPDSSAHRRR